ncbi:hypothetical protein B0O99DRAFT_192345 [Bisporella sp. PMI_857]|nr:hypothetical protein B0O99DRAFT_192345 [Bisporella sp. PMI_857]
MDLASGEATQRKDSLKCSSCDRTFARTEHLTRHMRSHRNEKPFKCIHCNSTFTRKDVVKRHHLRYHPRIPQVAVTSNSPPAPMAVLDRDVVEPAAMEQRQRESPSQHQEDNITAPQPTSLAVEPIMELEDYQDSLLVPPSITQPILDLSGTMSAFLGDMDYGINSNEWVFSNYDGGSNKYFNNITDIPFLNPNPPPTTSPPSSLSTELSHRFWRGSTEVSAAKRLQLVEEVASVTNLGQERRSFDIPSCLALERLVTSFFEVFLLYLPCVHVPTWKAETAHPCLLLAMAAMSAGYHKEHKTSQKLYIAARLSVTKYLGSSRAWTTEQPIWLIQSILILMALGTISGELATFNEALSWASLLANTIRLKKTPELDVLDNNLDLLTEWERWIEYETVVRTKSAAFCYLSNLNICFNVAPALLNWEMNNTLLPSEETEWTSPTPESWLEGRNHSPHSPVRFLEALDSLLSPTPQLQAVKMSSFGTYVMLHAIAQRMWRFQQDIWTTNSVSDYLSMFYITVQRWHVCWEENAESSLSPRNPRGAVSSNAAALLRLVHMRLHTDFSPVRSAILTHNVEEIARSMKTLSITIRSSSIATVLHAINALRTRVKLGMALKSWGTKSPHSVQVHLVSIECCLFSSAWMREVSTRPEVEWTPDEIECVRLVRETLGEVDMDPANAQKPYSTQLVYAWALIFECCAIWGIQSVLGDALKIFAESLPS